MPTPTDNFESRLDPTGEASVSAAELLQMVTLLKPKTSRWIGYVGSSAPDTTNNPELLQGIWLDNTTPTNVQAKYHNGTAWGALPVATGSISVATQIIDNIITLAKLAASDLAGKGSYVLRAKANESGYELIATSSLFTDNTLPIAKLVKGTDRYYLRSTATGVAWEASSLATDINALTDTINPNALQTGGVTARVLQTNSAGQVSYVVASDIFNSLGGLVITKLNPGTGNAGKFVKVNSTGDAMEFSAVGGLTAWSHTQVTFTTGSLKLQQTHSLNKLPMTWQLMLICVTAEGGYGIGDMLHGTSFFRNTDGAPAIQTSADLNSFYLNWDTGSSSVLIWNKATNASFTITPANWAYQFRAIFP